MGVPALGRAPRRSDFCYLIERVKKKLAGWKATQLSLTGRITLAKSVLEAMPIYPMMTMQLPSACIEEVHRLQRAFIWGDTSTCRKVHKVSWSSMNLPKEAGGLGLRNLYIMNEACLMKYGWTLRRGVDTLWSQVLVGKYGRGMIRQGHISVRGADSAFWKAMARVWPYLDTHQFWAVGNGDSIRAWEDKWVSSSLCIAEEVQSIPSSVRDWKVSNMVDDQGQWKITEFN